MKPFDLESARRGDPVCTADGREVRLYAFDSPETYSGNEYKLVGVMKQAGGNWVATSWMANGSYTLHESHADLRMAPRKETRWVVTWRNPNVGVLCCEAFETEARAQKHADFLKIDNTARFGFSINPIEVEL